MIKLCNFLKMSKSSKVFCWIDLEMTGLNIEKEKIIECACILTDSTREMNEIARFGPIVVKQPDELLDSMDDWNTKHHGESGLTKQVKESTITDADAEKQLLSFIKKYCPEKRTAYLAGNSVHCDKKFLDKYWPSVTDHLHYRILDVSSIKILAEAWYPGENMFVKRNTHRALQDIEESIKELKNYNLSLN